MMSKLVIEKKLWEIAQKLNFNSVEISVEETRNFIHIMFSTSDFNGKTMMERENIIWRELENNLDDETLISITQCYLLTPEEKSIAIPNS